MDLHVFPIPIPPPASLSTRFLFRTIIVTMLVLHELFAMMENPFITGEVIQTQYNYC